jgi:hypothetical protein
VVAVRNVGKNGLELKVEALGLGHKPLRGTRCEEARE